MDLAMRQLIDERCKYCSTVLQGDGWKSHFEGDYLHYKICTCGSCGKNNSLRIRFFASGHDLPFGGLKSIDSLVRKVCERER